MDSQNQPVRSGLSAWAKRLGVLGALGAVALLSGCSKEHWEVGFLPPEAKGATTHTDDYISLWNGGWIAALIVGFVTWGLLLWCVVAYRRRKHERGLPVQLAYNMPIEILYTVVPIILVVGFFFETVKAIEQTSNDDTPGEVVIEVVGKQWAWDFNYVTEDVHYSSTQVNLDGTEAAADKVPVLYLPSNTDLEIKLRSRDVIHSFWVPAFLEKRDMVPGRESSLHFQALKEGKYMGKCAELCGEFHSEMIFDVEVVPMDEYIEYTDSLREAGNTGILGPEYDRTDWYKNPHEGGDDE